MEKKLYKLNKILIYWLSFLTFFAIYYLYKKHSVGNDSSISEWLINYKGGFTRRGLGGEIAIFISNLVNLNLRSSILFLQVFFYLLYFLLFYSYTKNLKLNILQFFCLFSPIFLLFPLAEIESLGRKEIVLFCFFLLIVLFADKNFKKEINNFLIFFILPIVILIWEEVVLFFPFILCILVISREQKTLKEIIFKNSILFFPSIFTFIYLYLHPLDQVGHKIMCDYLMINFGERCYMSANMLVTHTIYFDTFSAFHKHAHVQHYFRYFMIFIIGYLPLHLLLIKNKFTLKNNFFSKNIKLMYLFFLLYFPASLLFIFAYDWGRWITIVYTFSFIFYLFLIKNNYITQKIFINKFLKKKFYSNKKTIIFLFILFAFSWNQKTVLTEKIGSFPVYRIVQKAIKWTFFQ